MRRHLRYPFTLLLCLALGLLGQASPVQAQEDPEAEVEEEDDEEAQAAKLFAEGRKLYEAGKHKASIEKLREAYELRPAPPILLNIARSYEKADDKVNALKYYNEFLQKARLNDPSRPMAEAKAKELEQQVGKKTGAVTSAAGTDTPTARTTGTGVKLPKRRQPLIHNPIDSAKVRDAITVMAEAPPGVNVDKMLVRFRRGGEARWRSRPMELQGEAWVARIPGRYVTSTSLQYYVEGMRGGKPVAEAGAKHTPHIVVIEGGRPPHLGKVKRDYTSPYYTWIWVSGAVAVASLGGSLAGLLLAKDRESAIEEWVSARSCPPDSCNGFPRLEFDDSGGKAQTWEDEGKRFSTMAGVLLGVGIAAAGASGFLFYMDRQWVKEARARDEASTDKVRFIAAPWATGDGAGFTGRIQF